FAGFTRQYACILQIQQHRFGLTAFLNKPFRIVQGRLAIAMPTWPFQKATAEMILYIYRFRQRSSIGC
ncbi:hypothetical protein, partial [Burkholderia cenocepacia]|uniref:hypothetical protein n=1 Tax=Burkholderia cenocepacia TaxID=95486 RepID=UPI001F2F6D83